MKTFYKKTISMLTFMYIELKIIPTLIYINNINYK